MRGPSAGFAAKMARIANGAFSNTGKGKNSANAAYGATILNARMVNGDSKCLKLPVFCEKLPRKNVFLAFKNTVKYKRRFDLNHDVGRGGKNYSIKINALEPSLPVRYQTGARPMK
jgi:hypothetical protein